MKRRNPKRIQNHSTIDRLERRGALSVWELTAADELVRAFRLSIGASAPRDPDLGIAAPCRHDAADESAAFRIDAMKQYRRWRKDLAGSAPLAAAVSLLFDEISSRAADRAHHWRNGAATAHLTVALRHFAALRGNTPRGVRWRFAK